MIPSHFDAIVVGSGPNGLAAAITIAQAGLKVCVLEAKATIGGGMRTAELTLPGFKHDICSAIHPMGISSPFFKNLPLQKFGLEWIFPPLALAHPFDDGSAAILSKSVDETAASLGKDGKSYRSLITPFVKNWGKMAPDFLGPINPLPSAPFSFAWFGVNALLPAELLAKIYFSEKRAKGFFAGMAGHSVVSLKMAASSAIGLVLGILGHYPGWPMPKGGSQMIAHALGAYLQSIGGEIITNFNVKNWQEIAGAKVVLFDTSTKTMMEIVKDKFPKSYQRRLKKFKAGMGVFKIDLALSEPIPFVNENCRRAGTIHLGSSLEEIVTSEEEAWKGKHSDRPYVLLAQQSLFDTTRTPSGKHTAWAYCHVPNGSTKDMAENIIQQIERYAPGFRDTILGTHSMSTEDLEQYNQNYTGGDINGGANTLMQIFGRPVLSSQPYRTPVKGIYLCSASTPPGGGVHGMSGYHAARCALKDLLGIELKRNPIENNGT